MPNYLFFYRGGFEGMEHASPDQIQQTMQQWVDWIQDGIREGWMRDEGDALDPGCVFVNEDQSLQDEPPTNSTHQVRGYSLVDADSLDRAVEIAKRSPLTRSGGSVEIRELAQLSGHVK